MLTRTAMIQGEGNSVKEGQEDPIVTDEDIAAIIA